MHNSTLTQEERVSIIASFNYYNKPKLNCKKRYEDQRNNVANKSKTDEQLRDYVKMTMSCGHDSGRVITISQGYKFTKCLCNFLNPKYGRYGTMFSNYEKGRPLYSQLFKDEPNKIIEIVEQINALGNELTKHQHDEMAKKSKTYGKS